MTPPSRRWELRVAALGLVAALELGYALPAAADQLDDRRQQLQTQVDSASAAVTESTKKLDDALARLKDAQDELAAAQAALTATQDRLTAAKAADARLADELTAAQVSLNDADGAVEAGRLALDGQRPAVGAIARDQVQQQHNLMGLAVLVGQGSAADLATRMQLSTTMLDTTQAQLDRLAGMQAQLEAAQATQAQATAKVAADRAAAAQSLVTLNQLATTQANQQVTLAATVRTNQQAEASARTELAKDNQSYQDLTAARAQVSADIAARDAAARQAAAASSATTRATAGTVMWRPAKGTTWQWQLTGTVDLGIDAAVFDLDGFDTSKATIDKLHQQGRRAICYIDAGSYENWRSDAGTFPTKVLGNTMDGWPGERWLDVRQLDVLKPIMANRIQMCKDKGFDAIEADNVDGYSNSTGFPISSSQQIAYNRMLAALAHERGLSIGLKNTPDLVGDLLNNFDFAVVEQCYQYRECPAFSPFITQGKAVLHVEYSGPLSRFCPTTKALGFSSLLKRLDLDAWRQVCP